MAEIEGLALASSVLLYLLGECFSKLLVVDCVLSHSKMAGHKLDGRGGAEVVAASGIDCLGQKDAYLPQDAWKFLVTFLIVFLKSETELYYDSFPLISHPIQESNFHDAVYLHID